MFDCSKVGASPLYVGTATSSPTSVLHWLRQFFPYNPSMCLQFHRKICDGYAAASARGISVLFASGDVRVSVPHLPHSHVLQGGVNGNHDDGFDCGLFVAVFPASCPYLTSVGSTIGFNPGSSLSLSLLLTSLMRFHCRGRRQLHRRRVLRRLPPTVLPVRRRRSLP